MKVVIAVLGIVLAFMLVSCEHLVDGTSADYLTGEVTASNTMSSTRFSQTTGETVTVSGILELIDGRFVINSGGTLYQTRRFTRYADAVDGLIPGTQISAEGYFRAPRNEGATERFVPLTVTIGGNVYELGNRGNGTRRGSDVDRPPRSERVRPENWETLREQWQRGERVRPEGWEGSTRMSRRNSG